MLGRKLVVGLAQTARFASTQAASAGGSGSSKFLVPGIVAAGAGAGYYYFNRDAAVSTIPSEPVFRGGDQGFVSLKLAKSEDLSHNTKRLTFEFDDPNAVSGMPYTSCLLTRYKPEGKEKFAIRPYTPTSENSEQGSLELVIKKYNGGVLSTHIHNLKPGETLDFKGPIPKFPWVPGQLEHVALIAGGTGITPMYQVIRAALADPNDKTKITLVFGNTTEQDILLHKELAHLETLYPRRFKAHYVLSKPSSEWSGGKGRIGKDLLKTVLPEPKEENIKVFVCGPPAMYKSISGNKVSPTDQGELSGVLKELGYKKEQVYKF